jgi:hypothetical protein
VLAWWVGPAVCSDAWLNDNPDPGGGPIHGRCVGPDDTPLAAGTDHRPVMLAAMAAAVVVVLLVPAGRRALATVVAALLLVGLALAVK